MKKKLPQIIAFILLTLFVNFQLFSQSKVKTTDKKASSQNEKLKKDGTPDMRYKENKEMLKEKPKGPTKKDGTPDMRYKDNKKSNKK